MIWYIYGCDLNRNHPEAGKAAQQYMARQGIQPGHCCKYDLSWLRAGDTIVTNCTQCDLIFAERTRDVKIMSLYEYVLNDPDFPWKDYGGETMILQDCFRTRDDAVLQEAVRRCMSHSNIRILETEHNRSDADFCGVWLNNPAARDAALAAPETFARLEKVRNVLSSGEQEEKMHQYVRGLPDRRFAVYCNGCEKGIRLGGGRPVHMIEVLFSA